MQKKLLVKALFQILGSEFKTSGNIENKLRELGIETAILIADAHYKKNDEEEDVFDLGVRLGNDAREKTVYRIEIDEDRLYFIGTEAEILRKIDEKEEELAEELGLTDDDITIEV